jgi:hypothetical protein
MKWHKVLASAILPAITAACVSVEKQGLLDWQNSSTYHVGTTGAGGLWFLANFAYAGMRVQGNQSSPGWRVLAFIFGFPGTLLSWLVIVEGSERAYGVDLPRPSAPSPRPKYPCRPRAAHSAAVGVMRWAQRRCYCETAWPELGVCPGV